MKNVLTKLNLIMSEINYIQKDKRNSAQNYSYLSEQAIKEAIQPLLVKNKVIFSVSILDRIDTIHSQTAKGTPNTMTVIKTQYTFFDCETGESLTGIISSSGLDSGDKGIFKAITGAIKYALTSTFLVPTGDDPEEDNDAESVVRPISIQQKIQSCKTLQELGQVWSTLTPEQQISFESLKNDLKIKLK